MSSRLSAKVQEILEKHERGELDDDEDDEPILDDDEDDDTMSTNSQVF